jgi:hypothetical protein
MRTTQRQTRNTYRKNKMNIGTYAMVGKVANEQSVASVLADRKLNQQEKVEKICDMISEAESAGATAVRCSQDFSEVVHLLWRMRGHVGQQAWRAMQEMINAHDGDTTGTAADSIIDRWECDWLRNANAE